ncbi:melanopsin-A-like [Seriola aureovittata]|uniref:melanopsin-A-like n=1 Tax=Seriola aureovittata TaxID=2871759 RepID=UPI0024BE7B98|nr:melanopsin-A-like [Seriola aureovittata]
MNGGNSALLRTARQSDHGRNCSETLELSAAPAWSGNGSVVDAHRLVELQFPASAATMVAMASKAPHPFPTVDVPDHAHYTIGSVILAIGITGMVGNFLVIYAFSRSRSLRTPANMFIINLAITDLLMCVTQTPIFFTTSMNKRWIFGEKGSKGSILILLCVPHSVLCVLRSCRYADMLTPYMNSVPAVIAKASAIHNPIIYAITHPKYRIALAKYIPCLGMLLCVHPRDLRSTSSSFMSTRRSTVTSQTSDISSQFRRQSAGKSRLSSASDSESGLTDTEADLSSISSRPASRQVSCDISRDTTELPDFKPSSSFKSKIKSHDSGIFEKTSYDTDFSTAGVSERSSIPNSSDFTDGHTMKGTIGRIPSIVITSESSPFLPIGRNGSRTARPKTANNSMGTGSG